MIRPRPIAAAILVAGWAAMLAITAPGFLSYDSVSQLTDARSGHYNSWHPPVMAWLLGLFDAVLPGTLLYLIFQSALLLGALLALLWCRPRGWPSIVVAAVLALLPQFLLFQGEVWKDLLFANAAIAGFAALALVAHDWRWRWAAPALLLLVLAASTRQNGVVLLPVAAVTLGAIARAQGRPAWRYGLGFLGAALVLGAGLNLALAARGDGGEGAAAQLRLGQAYDLAGALSRQPRLALPALAADPALDGALRRNAPLYTPLRVDTLAVVPAINDALDTAPHGLVAQAWRDLILDHPGLYLAVRWADFRAVLLSPGARDCHYAVIGISGDPALLRGLGLRARIRPRDQALADYAGHFFATPVYSHLAWAGLALLLLIVLARRRQDADVAVAGLLAGALLFTITFAIVSIACDYRYLIFLDLSAMAGVLYWIGTPKRV